MIFHCFKHILILSLFFCLIIIFLIFNMVFEAVILFFLQALGIENEDDLYKLVNFFLKYQTHHLPSSQVR